MLDDQAQEFDAAQAGHLDVCDHDREVAAGESYQGLLRVTGRNARVARAQATGVEVTHRLLVITTSMRSSRVPVAVSLMAFIKVRDDSSPPIQKCMLARFNI